MFDTSAQIAAVLIFDTLTYLDEKGDMAGSLIIVEAPTRADAMAFTENDPYVTAGLFSSIDVRPYRVTMNKLA